jgi:hypothetical protein
MREEFMNGTDEDVRTMMVTASSDMPPGIDLLRGLRERQAPARRPRPRYRMRALVSAGAVAVAGGGAVLGTTLTATVATAPSAFAAVTAAAAKTSAESFQMAMDATTPAPAGDGPTLSAHVTGKFDLSGGVGEEAVTGPWRFQVLFADHNTYVHTDPGSRQVVFPAGRASKPWWELPAGAPLTGTPIAATGDDVGGTPTSPAALLGLLKSAGTVTSQGPASGPGWTGTRYGFRVTEGTSTASGYVDVDGQGLVRRLVTALTMKAVLVWSPAAKPVDRPAETQTSTEDVTFSDFGAPVPVTAPAASQVDQLKSPTAMAGFGW